MRRAVAACIVLCVASLAGPAWAQDGHADGHADPNKGTIGAAAVSDGGSGSGGGGHTTRKPSTRSSKPACTYKAVDAATAAQLDAVDPHPAGSGHWSFKTCGGKFVGPVWIPNPSAGTGQDNKAVQLPSPDVGMSPPGDQLVGLTTWLWIKNWADVSVTADNGAGVRSTVTASPDSATWNFNDGTPPLQCGPGKENAPDCSHTFTKSSATQTQTNNAFPVTVTVRWHVTWTAQGAAGGGDLGFIERTTTIPVRVAEAQSINNG